MTDTPKGISVGEYAHSVAELVAEVAKRHKLQQMVAFQTVAWAVAHLESGALAGNTGLKATDEAEAPQVDEVFGDEEAPVQ